jgi:hypothetical protein
MVAAVHLKSLAVLVMASLVLQGCQSIESRKPERYLASYQDYTPAVKRFQVCHDVGCENLTHVSLRHSDWQKLKAYFRPTPVSAKAERERIGQAIAMFENIVGPLTNTQHDVSRNQPGVRWTDHQLDCVAETVNTTTYLLLLQQQGWLAWHSVGHPQHRGLFDLLGPHNTAVIVEKASGDKFVVDSWFHDNGQPPEIVTSEQWAAGYDPDDI